MLRPRMIQVGSQSIAVYESKGTGPAALMIHGNSMSSHSFEHQLQGSLGNAFRLVAIDLPGHGASAPAQNPAATYNLPGYASVIAAAATQLGLQDAVVVGWSLGGNIALELTNHLPQARGFFIFGAPPIGIPPAMSQAFLPNPVMSVLFNEVLSRQEIELFVEGCFPASTNPTDVPRFFREDIGRADGQARVQLGASVGALNYTDELQIVNSLTRPLAIIHGGQEQIVNGSYIQGLTIPTLWRGAVQIIPQAGHAAQWEPAPAFNALLESFLSETVIKRLPNIERPAL